MSENMREENIVPPAEGLEAIRSANKTKLKALAVLLNQAANNPEVDNDQLEQIVGMMDPELPHRLDTAADGCGR
jgi:hypothetical protein